MPHDYVSRMINIEKSDYNVVRRVAEELGFGERGLSAAIRLLRIKFLQEIIASAKSSLDAPRANKDRI